MRQTPISIKNVTPYVLNSPVGIDSIVKSLQVRFSTNLTWLTKSFNRAVITSNIDPNGDRHESAKCFISNGQDELDMIVNDNWTAYCFFLARDNESVLEYRDNQDSLYERELSVYFWLNMDEVDPTKDYPYLEEIKREILKEIRSTSFSGDSDIEILDVIDNPLDVFEGFTVDPDKTQLLYNPYAGLRIDLNCVYSDFNQCDIPLAAPSDFAFSNPTSSTLDATITSNSGNAENGFKWYISEDNVTFTLEGSTARNATSFQYTGLDPETTYYGKALAFGYNDSEFSNTDTSTTEAQYDPDAAAYFLRNPTLSDFEKDVWNTLIVSAKSAGNYDLIDELFLFGVTTGDYRIGLKSKTGAAFGGLTQGNTGIVGNGTNAYFDTNFNPSVDGVNYTLNDALIGGFIKEDLGTGNRVLIGSIDGSMRSEIFTNGTNVNAFSINANINTVGTGAGFNDNELLIHRRNSGAGNSIDIVRNGIVDVSGGFPSTQIPNYNFYVFASNNTGTPTSYYFNGTVSSIIIASAVGFDVVAHNEYMRIAIASLIDGTLVPDLATANTIINAA